MGHIAQLRKPFKLINTCRYIIPLIKRRKSRLNFVRSKWFFSWTNWNPLHPRMLCAKFGRNWPLVMKFNYLEIFWSDWKANTWELQTSRKAEKKTWLSYCNHIICCLCWVISGLLCIRVPGLFCSRVPGCFVVGYQDFFEVPQDRWH